MYLIFIAPCLHGKLYHTNFSQTTVHIFDNNYDCVYIWKLSLQNIALAIFDETNQIVLLYKRIPVHQNIDNIGDHNNDHQDYH